MSLEYRDLLNKLDSLNKKQKFVEGFQQWYKLVYEAPVKTKTKSKVDIDLDPDTGELVQPAYKEKPVSAPKRKQAKQLKMRDIAPMPDLDRVAQKIGSASTDDDYGDIVTPAPELELKPDNALGYDPEPEDSTDIATISKDMTEIPTDIEQRVHNVEWYSMMDLPGNAMQVIRNLGRRVFAAFGEQDFEKIDVISSFTNNEEDLDVVAGNVRKYGLPIVDQATTDFSDLFGFDYKAQTSVWGFGDQYYMFVKDDFGEYVYAWDNTEVDKLQHWEPGSDDNGSKYLN